ncbi:hypothetical protein [Haladaptatus sp. ZSTT2]|uniref:hypothetical protein n=1 Tax=Haladaptatus sp. ZSTT2 TaxID=3120515 RepID=UPI00300EADAC
MTFTDNSDVYTSLHEDGINQVIRHTMQKRPSLFHYGTENVVNSAALMRRFRQFSGLCARINYAPEVVLWDNPLMSVEDPFPVLGTDDLVALDYCFQVTNLDIDFSPDDPPADVGDQQFAARVVVCAGLACPEEEAFAQIRDELADLRAEWGDRLTDADFRTELGLPLIPSAEGLSCFCLGVTVIGSVSMRGPGADGTVVTEEDAETGLSIEIAGTPQLRVDDVTLFEPDGDRFTFPEGLTASMTCYLRSFVEFSLIPALEAALERIVIDLPTEGFLAFDLSGATLRISFPTSGAIPNNPAIEDDQLKVYTDVTLTSPGGSP